ncbi:MAG: 50S ribosomal protein L22 [Kiritimatiellae bacterium]|nr:50S ribosomal protein L22 [Kiritimatiellia bacterium]
MRYVRLPPLKARGLVRKLRGKPVNEALRIAEFSPTKAGRLIGKTIRSAIANAANNAKLPVDQLRVKEAVVEEGPRLKRYWPRARGMVRPILRRMAHIRIVLTDGKEEETET